MTTPLHHIVEPEHLLLTWQPLDEGAPQRTRRVVGEVAVSANGAWTFRYRKDHPDFAKAQEAGFLGFPAFDLGGETFSQGVQDTFLRRLPPRKREDFADFLALHRLPAPFPASDLALLGYTGARLPSDGFALVPVFGADAPPIDYILEVAGFRHAPNADVSSMRIGDVVHFELDSTNPVDHDALAMVYQGQHIGYVNRVLRHTLQGWLANRQVSATIERVNGKPERPLVYLRLQVI